MTYSVILLKAIEKILHFLDVQTKSVPIEDSHCSHFGFRKAGMFCLSSFLFGFDGLVFFLVAMRFGRSSEASVVSNPGGTTIVARNLMKSAGSGAGASWIMVSP
jgi:hypothetical protein